MANKLDEEKQNEIFSKYLETASVKATAQATGVARNSVRSVLRSQGFNTDKTAVAEKLPAPLAKDHVKRCFADTKFIDFSFVEKIFDLSKGDGENLNFKEHILSMVNAIVEEVGIFGALDQIKLETAMLEYIRYRRFYLASLNVSEKQYVGPYSKLHDKQAKAANQWAEASQKALAIFTRNIRELEIKHGLFGPNYGRGNTTFINNQEINVKREV